MNYRVFASKADTIAALAQTIVERAEEAERFVISLSGGSTPKALYERLGQNEMTRLAARRIVWVVGDERCVPPDHEMSNSRMINETLFASGIPDGHTFLRFRTELEDPAVIASAFEGECHALSLDRLDFALLGVGDDGHTASLFPGTDVLAEGKRISREVWVERLASWRVTLTIPAIRSAKIRVVLAVGENKRDILTKLRDGVHFPVASVMGDENDAWWFVDAAAYPGEAGG